MKSKKPDLLDWLHIKKELDFSRFQSLGAFVSSIALLILLAIVAFSIVGVFVLLGAVVGVGPYSGDVSATAIRNLGLVLIATFGAPFLVWRSIVAQKQVNVAEQSQITDRINKVVEGLGSVKLVREVIETPRYQRADGNWKRDENDDPVPALRPDGKPLIDREVVEKTSPNLEVRIGAIYALERMLKIAGVITSK